MARRQLQPAPVLPVALDAELHRRRAVHRRRLPPHDRGHRSGDRRDAVDVSRAQHEALGGIDARQLRQGRGLRRNRRARRHLRHHAGVLPARARREDRRAPGGIRRTGRHPRLPGDRRRRPAGRPRLPVRPRERDSDGDRLHHELVAPHRRQRHRRGGQRARAGLQPVAHRERAGPHPGLRRAAPASTSGSSTSSRSRRASSASTPGRTTPGSGRATSRRGPRSRPTSSAASSTFRPTRRPSTTTAGSGPATTSSATA